MVLTKSFSFCSYYGSARRLLWRNTLFLHKKGLETFKQPVFIGDCVSGFVELVKRNNKEVAGKTYQFVGYVLFSSFQINNYG